MPKSLIPSTVAIGLAATKLPLWEEVKIGPHQLFFFHGAAKIYVSPDGTVLVASGCEAREVRALVGRETCFSLFTREDFDREVQEWLLG